MAKQSTLTPDPFEIVLKNAQKQDNASSLAASVSNINNEIVTSGTNENVTCVNKTENSVNKYYQQSHDSIEVKSEHRYSSPANESVTVAEADSQSLTIGDISCEEDLKAIIAKRINNVVTKALNDSRPSSPTDTEESNAPKMTYMNRRSLSFITETKKNDKSEKLNKSFSFSQCPQFNADTKTIKSPDSSIWLLDNSNQFNLVSLIVVLPKIQ